MANLKDAGRPHKKLAAAWADFVIPFEYEA
jgi:hypothetical protein